MIFNLGRACALQNGKKWIWCGDKEPSNWRPPLFDLFEWIFLKYPEDSRKLLRQRVLVISTPTPFEAGLIKTLGKRWQLISKEEMAAIQNSTDSEQVECEKLLRPPVVDFEKITVSSWSEAALRMKEWVEGRRQILEENKGPRHKRDRPIVAALFDKQGRLLAKAFNTNGHIRTRHAEINLLESLGAERLPEDSVLFVSMQCCRMCAGAIMERMPTASRFKVYYLEPEPKLKNVKTALHGVEERLQRTQ